MKKISELIDLEKSFRQKSTELHQQFQNSVDKNRQKTHRKLQELHTKLTTKENLIIQEVQDKLQPIAKTSTRSSKIDLKSYRNRILKSLDE